MSTIGTYGKPPADRMISTIKAQIRYVELANMVRMPININWYDGIPAHMNRKLLLCN